MSQSTRRGQPNPHPERSGTLIDPGASFPVPRPGRPQPIERSGTLIETDDDIRQELRSGLKGRQPGHPVAVDPTAPLPARPPAAVGSAFPFPPGGAAAGGCIEFVRVSHTLSKCGSAAVLIGVVAGSQ
jgi:hypothetical protein